MRRLGPLLLVLLLGCTRKQSAPMDAITTTLPEPRVARRTAVSPGPFYDVASGVRAVIPAGWIGEQGFATEPMVFRVLDPTTGGQVVVYAGLPEGVTAGPRETCDFTDSGSYRAVPAVEMGGSATCIPDDPYGLIRQVWWGQTAAGMLHLELHTPPGGSLEAERAALPLIRSVAVAP